jgi:hypothetical protein
MRWCLSHRADTAALDLADRHYNRRKIGSPQYVPPGRNVCFLAECGRACWVTSWPFAEYVKHEWPGAWVNSLFRNEGAGLSSDLIREAIAATRSIWPDVPELGLITFVDADKTRRKRDPGRCYRKAGFSHVGFTKGGLWALQMRPEDMPAPTPAKARSVLGLPLFGFSEPASTPQNEAKMAENKWARQDSNLQPDRYEKHAPPLTY